jgi:transcription initiation factor TFIIIB Brf1 subunit/transcription initiation factor TFIIB
MTTCPSCGGTGPFDPMAPGELACGDCGEVFKPADDNKRGDCDD